MARVPDHLETQRPVLRKPRHEDGALMFVGWTQDAEVTRCLTWRPHEAVTQAGSFVAHAIEAWSGDEPAVYVITTRERDVPIGLIEVRFESAFAASVGYVLQRSEWNRGYMAEACSAPGRPIIHDAADLAGVGVLRRRKRRVSSGARAKRHAA